MNKKIYYNLLLIIAFLGLISIGGKSIDVNDSKNLSKPTGNDHYNYIAINQILMYVSNNGDGSHDPRTSGNGFYWPGGKNATKSAIFEDGLIWAGKIGREVRMNGNTHRQGLQAGKILPTGLADLPGQAKYRVYKIRKGWERLPPSKERDEFKKDYDEWPVEDGAPWVDVDGDGIYTPGTDTPHFIGDEVLWYVANDLDPARSTRTYGSQPIGLEFQTTIFGFNRTGPLGDMVFKKYKVINKSENIIDSMYFGYWSDTDLGDANDDYTGCDTILSLGYTYNATNKDLIYGTPVPAVGYDFFQGPVIPYDTVKYPIIIEKNLPDSAKFDGKWIKGKTNLPMTAFTFYINPHSTYRDPTQGNYQGTLEFYYYLRGFVWNGNPFLIPGTSTQTKFVLAGDPVNKTGWYEGAGWSGGPTPGDRRHLMCSGPFTMAPGDTQEIVVGILIAQGTDNFNSVKVLKSVDEAAQLAYDLDFKLTPSPGSPEITTVAGDRRITFYWGNEIETYEEIDPLLKGRGLTDTSYKFEGYEVYQYRDLAGTDPVLLATYDRDDNEISEILDFKTVEGRNIELPVIFGTNSGLYRFFELNSDVYTQTDLRNGTPYYIGVVAYGYCPNSSPRVLKSTHSPIEVFPAKQAISSEYTYVSGDYVNVERISGISDGVVRVRVVDPEKLTGDKYKVTFTKAVRDSVVWNLINTTKNDTVLKNQTTIFYRTDFYTKDGQPEDVNILNDRMNRNNFVIDGMIISVGNPGRPIGLIPGQPTWHFNKIKEISLVKDEGKDVTPTGFIAPFVPRQGLSVYEGRSTTSSRNWWVTSWESKTNPVASLQNIMITRDSILGDDYEIRFSNDSSEYYVAFPGFGTGINNNNPKSTKGKLPFQFWNIKNPKDPADDVRWYIKVFETELSGIRDSLWTPTIINKGPVLKDSIQYEDLYFFVRSSTINVPYQDPIPAMSGSTPNRDMHIGKFTFMTKKPGDLPKQGTVIRIITWKSLTDNDVFEFTATKPMLNDPNLGKKNIDKIGVFPNPYLGSHNLERDKYQRFVRFTHLPPEVTIRLYSLSGVFINKIEKNNSSTYADWDLRNSNGIPVASGVYIAYIEMPGIGSKTLKIAVIMETQYIDRL